MIVLPPSDDDLHAYIDLHLGLEDRLRLEAWLEAHPEVKAQVQAWQQDAHQLRAAWSGALQQAPNPNLDPTQVQRGLRHRRTRRLAKVAVLVMAIGVGAWGGWQARGPGQTLAAAPMADALQAYRLFAAHGTLPADYSSNDSTELQAWLDRYFRSAQRLPDLAAAGFRPRSARLFSTDQGPAAMVVYESTSGQRASFYVRPPGPGYHLLPRGSRRDGELEADYWSDPTYNYAMVSTLGAPTRDVLNQAIGDGI